MSFGSATDDGLTTVEGAKLAVSKDANLVAFGKRISHPCVNATITVGAENTNVRAITIQLLDAYGNDVSEVTQVGIVLFTSAAGTAYATTGGSTGIAIGTDGALLTVVARKYFLATSEADGDIDLTWTDTGTEQVAVGVILPNGNIVISSAFANT